MYLMRIRVCFLLFCLAWNYFSCKDSIPVKKESNTYDLVKQIDKAKILNFHFDEKKNLTYYQKKNTARYSVLPKQRFINSQITFNTEKDLFVNESKDSILLSPNSSIEFELEKDVYQLDFSIGLLSNGFEKAGRLAIELDGKLDEENSFLIEDVEKWKSVSKIIRIDKKIKFIWNSNEAFLTIGHPILTPVNQKKKNPNIILIVVDSMRYDSLSQNGNAYLTTPNLDKLAEDSINFSQAFSNANWTKPSMISMFYSEYTSNLGLGNTGFEVSPDQKKIFYSNRNKGIVNYFRDKKYYTASIMNNVFLLDYTGVGVDIGFHEIFQVGKDIDDTLQITSSAIDFLEKEHANPFFLHINYNTPHGPYTPPKKNLDSLKLNLGSEAIKKENQIIKKYLAEVNFADEQIGVILEKLKNKNLYEQSFIIITSDHGELFSEHHTAEVNGINGIKYGHGVTHYDEEIHIPLILKVPNSIKEKVLNKKINFPFSLISLFPTVLGLTSLNSENLFHKGLDISSNIFGQTDIKEKSIYSEGRLSESIRTEKLKYIRRYPFFTNSELKGRILQNKELEEIYDIFSDPEERVNLIQDKELLKSMRETLEKNSLQMNSFFLEIPKSEKQKIYSGSLFIPGNIYSASGTKNVEFEIASKRTINFKVNSSKEISELKIMTVKPDLNFDLTLYSENQPIPFRIGKWGISYKNKLADAEKLIVSNGKPEGIFQSDLPWIYNDSKISSQKTKDSENILGPEVRQILKSWGYIHE
jgi:arylsulfatase A-like enzyme